MEVKNNVVKLLSQAQKIENKTKWIIFFRNNIHRFIEMYFGIELYPHQRLEFFLMSQHTNYAEIASRGTAKSWKGGVFALAWCVLYPNSEIVIVAESKKQAGIIIDKKIRPLYEQYENVNKEIKSIVNNNNDMEIRFNNGSVIFVVPLRESARGNRCTLLIKEEARLLDKEKIDSIISPFKHPRQVPYLKNPKYSKLAEEPREITISSSGRESEVWYNDIKKIIKDSINGKDSICLFADYIIGLRYNMHTVNQISKERIKLGEESFAIEYENALIRENKDTFFTNSLIESCRTLKTPYYPQHFSRYVLNKNPLAIPQKDGELIVITVDIAMKASSNNDNTIIKVDRLMPTKKGYQHNFVYTETMRGKNTLVQALRIKQLWCDFSANYIVIDTNGNGIGVYDAMTEITVDNTRGIEYPAMTSMYHKSISKYDDYRQRTKAIDALPIVYPMWASEAMNSECAFLVRDLMKSDMIKMLCKPNDGEEFLLEKAKYFDVKKDMDLFSWFMMPYYQESETQGEMTNLKPIYSGNQVKLIETKNGRKDRYTALAYVCYFVKIVLDPLIVKETREINYKEQVVISTPTINKQSSRFGGKSGFGNFGRRGLFGR